MSRVGCANFSLSGFAKKLLAFIPQPNQPDNVQGFFNHCLSPQARTDEYDQCATRLAHRATGLTTDNLRKPCFFVGVSLKKLRGSLCL
jgi:hypothetical protein